MKPQYKVLLRQLWQRQFAAELKTSPEATAQEKGAVQAAQKELKELQEQPEWIKGPTLFPHQLKVFPLHLSETAVGCQRA